MPVSTDYGEPPAKCCKYCDEFTDSVDGPVSWRLTLDQDLIDTLQQSFPNWFNSTAICESDSDNISTNYHFSGQLLTSIDRMAEGERSANTSTSTDNTSSSLTSGLNTRHSPPKAVVDSSPLQPAMDKNKESLKVKLMMRRPITQLVEQGILPPLKTSPAIHEQRKQLQRAKTGDLLKAKIQQRPDRQELERRHILEHDESHVDPSLAEKQRMLKKARLADQLNSQISHRPGPLELIKKNILHTEEPIERIVKEGLVTFKATSEGLLSRPQQPHSYITFEEDSQSSEGDQRSSPARGSSAGSDVIETAAASAGIVTVALTIPTTGGAVMVTSATPVLQSKFHSILAPYVSSAPPPPPPLPIKNDTIQISSETPQRFAELCQSVVGYVTTNSTLIPIAPAPSPSSLASTSSSLSPISSVPSPQQQPARPTIAPATPKSDAPGKDKYRKKSKSKPVVKARPIKFHEYKGPPNAQKVSSLTSSAQTEETSYQLLLKQQNCLLEYLEGLNKTSSTGQQTPVKSDSSCNSVISQPIPSPAQSVASSTNESCSFSETSTAAEIAKLEKMKVFDLKLQLKKRNLPVSGPKPQLIERLKPYLPLEPVSTVAAGDVVASETTDLDVVSSMSPESDEPENMDVQSYDAIMEDNMSPAVMNEELVKEQQRKIDELQRKLKESQDELLQMKQIQTPVTEAPALTQKMIVKQQLEAKIQKEKLQQLENLKRQQKELIKAEVKSEPHQHVQITDAQLQQLQQQQQQSGKNNVEIVWNGEPTLLLVNLRDKKENHQQTSIPRILVPIAAKADVEPPPLKPQEIQVLGVKSEPPLSVQFDEMSGGAAEALKFITSQTTSTATPTTATKTNGKIPHRNSQLITDVLEILIRNGELPESAAQIPVTPTTPGTATGGATGPPPLMEGIVFTKPNLPAPTEVPEFGSASENGGNAVESMDLLSPLHPDPISDAENAVDTLNMFLEQSSTGMDAGGKECDPVDLNHFDDLAFMELMSHQMDMDITEDGPTEPPPPPPPYSRTRREMNPSLQPSLSELIQQQSSGGFFANGGQSTGSGNNNLHSSISNNNLVNEIQMEMDEFSNSLPPFDFPALSGTLSHDVDNPTTPFTFSSVSGLSTSTATTADDAAPTTSVVSSHCGAEQNLYDNAHVAMQQDNLLDLLSFDDLRMSGESMPWSEVDFAV
ncbi:myocardin-related transcription factor A isoform X2 [Phlebotomus papatasi]|uniref:myocardin-related transcription factor A isoform X2 n=1 Tax=Phlebotomus papatasi TaxID=29031 RepID=UPI0024844254|nr:myocardin-related transcription factor A isoform X2 [Phlebotomus papatasi]